MPNYLLHLPAAYVTFLESDGPKNFNGWYSTAAKFGFVTTKVRFLVYKPNYPGDALSVQKVIDTRMGSDEDRRFERYVKLMGDAEGAMNVFDTVDGVAE